MSTVLIAYDGSPDALHAITEAARLLPGSAAVVLSVRQPLESIAAHLEGHPALDDMRGIDEKTLDASERLAAGGADHARRVGLWSSRPAPWPRPAGTRHPAPAAPPVPA